MSRLTERLARQPRLATTEPTAAASDPVTVGVQPRNPGLGAAESNYDACRQAWLDALRASRSGRNADLARLAVAQTAYEEAQAELDRARAEDALQLQRLEAVRRRRDEVNRRAEAIANQAAAWNRVHESRPERRGLLSRLFRRS